MRFLLLIASTAALTSMIALGATHLSLSTFVSLSHYRCGDEALHYDLDGLSLLIFGGAHIAAILLSRHLVYRRNYIKLVDADRTRALIGFHASGVALFLLLSVVVMSIYGYFNATCAELETRGQASNVRNYIIFQVIFYSAIATVFSDLIRYRAQSK